MRKLLSWCWQVNLLLTLRAFEWWCVEYVFVCTWHVWQVGYIHLFTDVYCKTCACTYRYADVCILCWTCIFAKFHSLFPPCYLLIYRSRKRNHWVFSVPLLCKMNSTTVRDLYSQFLKISVFQSWFEFLSLRLQLFSFVWEVNPAFTFYFIVTMHLSFCLFGAFDDKL